MLMQVLSLTQDQINSLPPTERDQIQQLVRQTLSCPRLFLTNILSNTLKQRKQFGIAV